MDEKINENFKNKTKIKENIDNLPKEDSLNYHSQLYDKAIAENLNKLNMAEEEFERAVEELNNQHIKLKTSLSANKDELEAYAVKHLDELKNYESDLKSKFNKVFDIKPSPSQNKEPNEEQIGNLMDLLLDESGKRFILQEKSAEGMCSAKKQTEILQKDYENLKILFEKEQQMLFQECESIAKKLKDCHIVFSNDK